MQTDREKALHYVTRALNPGDTFTAKDLGHFIGRKKSETLRVVQWLQESGYIDKRGKGPSTSYLVLKWSEEKRAVYGTPQRPDIKIIDTGEGTSFVRTDEKPDVEESIHAIPENMTPSISKAYIAQKNQELLEKSRATKEEFIKQPPSLDNIDRIIQENMEKVNANRAHKLFRLEEAIESKLMATQDRLQFLKIAYAKEPIFRNDYLLQFLYGQLEILEELKGMG